MTGIRSVSLDELDSEGFVVSLSARESATLAATELVEVRPEGAGVWRLFPRGRVGAVRVGDLQVEVRPKEPVGLSQLLFYLGYARDPGFRADDVMNGTRAGQPGVLARPGCRPGSRARCAAGMPDHRGAAGRAQTHRFDDQSVRDQGCRRSVTHDSSSRHGGKPASAGRVAVMRSPTPGSITPSATCCTSMPGSRGCGCNPPGRPCLSGIPLDSMSVISRRCACRRSCCGMQQLGRVTAGWRSHLSS